MMSAKIRVKQVLLVEGKYDAAKLSSLVDGLILTTDGFGIYKDKEKQALLKELGRLRVIILTDSDGAGFRIRNFVSNLVGEQYVRQAYVPALPGKEARKAQPGKEGLLGVEGVPAELIRQAVLTAAGNCQEVPRSGRAITYADLFDWGLSGTAGSAEVRRAALRRLGLPPRLSKKALCQVLNELYSFEELDALLRPSETKQI